MASLGVIIYDYATCYRTIYAKFLGATPFFNRYPDSEKEEGMPKFIRHSLLTGLADNK
jgi:hypothetical protein